MVKNRNIFILLVAKSIGSIASITCHDGDFYVIHLLCTVVGGSG